MIDGAKTRWITFISVISTVEGILSRTIEGLTQDQPVRRHMDPEGAAQIDAFVTKIEELRDMSKPFTLVSDSDNQQAVCRFHFHFWHVLWLLLLQD